MLRCLFEADSMDRPLFPDTKSRPAQPYARTRPKLRVKSLTLALSTRIPPQGKLLLPKRNEFQTTPREFASNTSHERGWSGEGSLTQTVMRRGHYFGTQYGQSRP